MSVDLFALKRVFFLGKHHNIIVQNENGPCPLVAVANILLLTQRMSLDTEAVTQRFVMLSDLIQLVADVVLRASSSRAEQTAEDNEQRNMMVSAVFELLPKLGRGLDLNVQFTKPTAMEFTEELSIFDSLNIPLVHGWLIDTQGRYTETIGSLGYNQLMYEIVAYRTLLERTEKIVTELGLSVTPDSLALHAASHAEREALRRGPLIEEFLAESASQLTYIGLVELHQAVREHQMAVLFRNNHFSTLYKHDSDLYLLVTDAGFADQEGVVWERLDEIDGNTDFFDGSFRPVGVDSASGPVDASFSSSSSSALASTGTGTGTDTARGFGGTIASPSSSSSSSASSAAADPELDASLALALRLDREDRERADREMALELERQELMLQQQQQQQQQQHHHRLAMARAPGAGAVYEQIARSPAYQLQQQQLDQYNRQHQCSQQGQRQGQGQGQGQEQFQHLSHERWQEMQQQEGRPPRPPGSEGSSSPSCALM